MVSFNRSSNRSDGNFNRSSNSSFKPAIHKAICSECGDACEIPFKPTGSRPVFCSNCFAKQNDGSNSRPSKFRSERRPSFNSDDRQMYDAVSATCGNDCQVPFRPTSKKPVFLQ